MGVSQRRDSNPKTRPGVTGFEQDYNEEPPPAQDLNPDAVTEDSVLPTPQTRAAGEKAPRAAKRGRKANR
jgi:hypothetical protein